MCNEKEAEKAAREYAAVNYDTGAVPEESRPLIKTCGVAAISGFLAGVEWERKRRHEMLASTKLERLGKTITPSDCEVTAISGKRFEDDI